MRATDATTIAVKLSWKSSLSLQSTPSFVTYIAVANYVEHRAHLIIRSQENWVDAHANQVNIKPSSNSEYIFEFAKSK